jgi:hypothetical protein
MIFARVGRALRASRLLSFFLTLFPARSEISPYLLAEEDEFHSEGLLQDPLGKTAHHRFALQK